jgi:ABC-2 type transport system ATP-binding protein
MLQTGGLPEGAKVTELIGLFRQLYHDRRSTAELLGLAGIGDLADRRVEQLSGGQAQRVRFALALVGDPRLLVLDEPTAGLDVAARREFWSSVREFVGGGRSVLFSTHYLEEADEMADRIVLLNAGTVVADGTAAAIRAVASYRVVRCTLPGVADAAVRELPAVREVERRGDTVVIRSGDSDRLLRALLERYPEARDVEVTAAPLADAFLALTAAGAADRAEVA